MSQRFAWDFSHVRVHTDATAAASARSIGAAAFTVGNHIVFGAGQFAPSTPAGSRVLAHELTHTIQAHPGQTEPEIAQPSDPLEREAASNAYRIHDNIPLRISPGASHRIHRQSQDDDQGSELRTPNARVIYLDGNLIEEELKRGNENVARTLRGLLSTADVRLARWTYHELVEKPELPRTSVANRLMIEELSKQGLRVEATYPPLSQTVDRRLENDSPRPVTSELDLQLVAAARAGRGEIWSVDKVFARNGKAVEQRFGVKVATESALGSGGSGAKDYRVARQLMGLAPIDISMSGVVRRQGGTGNDSGGTSNGPMPSAKGGGSAVTPKAIPTPQGRFTDATGPRAEQGSTRALVGSPDMTPPMVFGPSPRGTAIAQGAVVALQGLNWILKAVNDAIEAERVQAALDLLQPRIAATQLQHPSHGVLLVLFFARFQPVPDSPLVPPMGLTHIEMGSGISLDEARIQWRNVDRWRNRTPGREVTTQELWIPPPQPAEISSYRTPFDKFALATFTAGTPILQDVNWGGVTGFDDEGITSLSSHRETALRFFLLSVPSTIQFFAGSLHEVSIPVEDRTVATGEAVPAVNLDPIIPGDAAAICAFPADEQTVTAFSTAPATHDNYRQLDRYPNFGMVRWVPPENVTVIRKL
ncbi:DUF4157 domain-containing protein [Streptomyces durmitorensis]|uniref:DUF4157 domain-containing protein n=2 Tax=Streptomyces durmitorensis TaxID=319947 RepID=A0ABY4Q5P5_9ACTN|nr:DUF4157 domain-containing protein [Streptomyces durmitorensis]